MPPKNRISRNPFRFKQFSVSDDRCAMKVGTDAVLLGAWADVVGSQRLLDVGTGCGIIALMLAQRTSDVAQVEGIDIAQYDCEQARENVSISPWPNKIAIHHLAIQEFNSIKEYDHIVSNPPFFVNSLPPPSGHRRRVRHNDTLTFEDLCSAVHELLDPSGKFSVILPTVEGTQFQLLAASHGLHLARKTIVHSKPEKPAERLLMEFRKEKIDLPWLSEMTLLTKEGKRSGQYELLTGEFYP